MRRVVAVAALAAMTIASAGSAMADSNSDNAKKCQKNGWRTLMGTNGTVFANERQCVSFAAQGGVLVPLQRPPVANNDTATTNEDTAVTIAVLGNDTDVDGHALSITAASASNGAVTFGGGSLTYTPAANFNGPATLSYTISDGHGGTASATVTVTVNAVNDAPDAVDDTATTDEDTAVTFDVLGNDTDVDGDALTITAAAASRGGVTIDGGSLAYTPNANLNGLHTLTYTISDGNGGTDTGTAIVTVNPVNDPIVANDDTATTNEDTAVTIQVLANDIAVDGILKISSAFALHGTVQSIVGGALIYTPDPDFNGEDHVTYSVVELGGGADSGGAHVSITVNPVNDAPVANNDTASVNYDERVIIDVLANDTDVDGDTLTITGWNLDHHDGVATLVGGSLNYLPDPTFDSPATFTYTISDGLGGTSTATVTVTRNDHPAN